MTLVKTATPENGSKSVLLPYDQFDDINLAVASDTFVDIAAYDVSEFKSVLFHLYNSHASNGLVYKFLGTADSAFDAESGSDASCLSLLDADVTLAAETPDAQVLTDDWKYIFIQVKRATSAQDSKLDLHVIGRKE